MPKFLSKNNKVIIIVQILYVFLISFMKYAKEYSFIKTFWKEYSQWIPEGSPFQPIFFLDIIQNEIDFYILSGWIILSILYFYSQVTDYKNSQLSLKSFAWSSWILIFLIFILFYQYSYKIF